MLKSMIVALVLLHGLHMDQDKTRLAADNELVRQWIVKTVGTEGALSEPVSLDSQTLSKVSQGRTFHSLHYPEYPVARMAPGPLGMRNVFTVGTNGEVALYKTREALRKDFVKQVSPVAKDDLQKVALDWAKVSSVFSQDGFFEFVFNSKNVVVQDSSGHTVVTVVAPVVEKAGDKGELTATLTFTPVGGGSNLHLDTIFEKDTVQPGIRPICQCTLLLDKNPIVRKIAERDLLVMGEAAFPYMKEQMDKASPALKREIERVRQRILRGER